MATKKKTTKQKTKSVSWAKSQDFVMDWLSREQRINELQNKDIDAMKLELELNMIWLEECMHASGSNFEIIKSRMTSLGWNQVLLAVVTTVFAVTSILF